MNAAGLSCKVSTLGENFIAARDVTGIDVVTELLAGNGVPILPGSGNFNVLFGKFNRGGLGSTLFDGTIAALGASGLLALSREGTMTGPCCFEWLKGMTRGVVGGEETPPTVEVGSCLRRLAG